MKKNTYSKKVKLYLYNNNSFYRNVWNKYHLYKLNNQFRTKYPHNEIVLKDSIDLSHLNIGHNNYGILNVICSTNDKVKLIIGSYCSIAPNVLFLLADEHQINSISTYPFKVKRFGENTEAVTKGNIVIDDDVWIGANVTICSGIHIGQGAVIAAGSVVTKNVEPYSVIGGNPAKIIKKRFSQKIIDRLLSIDIVTLFDSIKKEDLNLFYQNVTDDILDTLINKYLIK